ncbi:ADP-ribosyl cyclase/cyclic ADP-ribose hydrolase 1-like isoform X2 [Paramisgurnus dabryanus]|uniref:ADP-ribosyl cyclase/cyclic ADP-ribose hydrolase 1-like isoform X2 n=1 Tax=Paramisgurnus dabryanus TaxID=90735 RepID=UPI0031F4561D
MEYQDVMNSNVKSKRKPYILAGTATVLVLAIILAVVLVCTIKSEPEGNNGLKETVLSRCQSYVNSNPSALSGNDCEDIWKAFEHAYVGKDPCSVPPETYNHLMNSVQQKIPCNTLFWSGTKEMVFAFTKDRDCLMTLEETLLGSMFNGLTWCSNNGSKETFTTGCPVWTKCVNNPVRSFWNRASANFAATACGNVSVMLNGSKNNPFNTESIFATVEIKNFNPTTMDSLTVLLVTENKDMTTCSNESLENLQSIFSSGPLKSVGYKCRVVPQAKVMECIDDLEIPCSSCW